MKTRVNKYPTPNKIAFKLFNKSLSQLESSSRDRVIREYQNKRNAYKKRLNIYKNDVMLEGFTSIYEDVNKINQFLQVLQIQRKQESIKVQRATQVNPFKRYSSGKTNTIGAHGIRP